MSHRTNFSALDNTVLLGGEKHPYPKLYLDIRKRRSRGEEKKEKEKRTKWLYHFL